MKKTIVVCICLGLFPCRSALARRRPLTLIQHADGSHELIVQNRSNDPAAGNSFEVFRTKNGEWQPKSVVKIDAKRLTSKPHLVRTTDGKAHLFVYGVVPKATGQTETFVFHSSRASNSSDAWPEFRKYKGSGGMPPFRPIQFFVSTSGEIHYSYGRNETLGIARIDLTEGVIDDLGCNIVMPKTWTFHETREARVVVSEDGQEFCFVSRKRDRPLGGFGPDFQPAKFNLVVYKRNDKNRKWNPIIDQANNHVIGATSLHNRKKFALVWRRHDSHDQTQLVLLQFEDVTSNTIFKNETIVNFGDRREDIFRELNSNQPSFTVDADGTIRLVLCTKNGLVFFHKRHDYKNFVSGWQRKLPI